jgi:8-oxo-dGTP pyrophosphatase MutT (NUDIX family)
MVTHTILCYLIKDNKVLLQKKSKGLFGGGKWNGPGGKLKENENPQDCAKREIIEEIGVKVSNLRKRGLLKFFKGNDVFIICDVFATNEFEGEPKSGREGMVDWFNFNDLPFKEMWPDDKLWMPLMLQGKEFEGDFYFDDNLKEILNYKLNVI